MILAHAIVGLMPVTGFGFSWFWFLGSVIPDVDHLFVLYTHRIFSWGKFIDTIRFEEKYGLRYKTKYAHSIFGAIIMTFLIAFIDIRGSAYFSTAYIIHLLLDWPDRDEKQYLFPFSKRIFKGFLPIFSMQEIIFTLLLFGLYLYLMGFV